MQFLEKKILMLKHINLKLWEDLKFSFDYLISFSFSRTKILFHLVILKTVLDFNILFYDKLITESKRHNLYMLMLKPIIPFNIMVRDS